MIASLSIATGAETAGVSCLDADLLHCAGLTGFLSSFCERAAEGSASAGLPREEQGLPARWAPFLMDLHGVNQGF